MALCQHISHFSPEATLGIAGRDEGLSVQKERVGGWGWGQYRKRGWEKGGGGYWVGTSAGSGKFPHSEICSQQTVKDDIVLV